VACLLALSVWSQLILLDFAVANGGLHGVHGTALLLGTIRNVSCDCYRKRVVAGVLATVG